MTPTEWNTLLAPDQPWQAAYAVVERHARAHLLANVTLEHSCGTSELVDALYPARFARGPGILARKRLFKALAALATKGLADCCHKGVPRKVQYCAQPVRPWLWHAPGDPLFAPLEARPINKCPHCGEELL